MLKSVMSIGVLALLAAFSAYAEQPRIHANLSFEFLLAGQRVPAGEYAFSLESGGDFVSIQGPGQYSARLLVSTRLAGGASTGSPAPRLVFGKDGDARYLSEIWFPNEGGIQVLRIRSGDTQEVVEIPGDGGSQPVPGASD